MDEQFTYTKIIGPFSLLNNTYMEMSYQALMNGPEWKFRDVYRYNAVLRVKHGLEMSRIFLN
jgi:hypothetical protein